MKVAAICPTCSRPASTKGRSVCLYCGAPLQPVVTGKVSAAQSGIAIDVPPELRREARASAAPVAISVPVVPVPRPSLWRALGDRPLVAALLWCLGVGAAILFLGSFIAEQQDRAKRPQTTRRVR
ncbi:MAG: hypothetical protein JNK60_00805 [Acidobacteria bacterium]|nr:hypothetical protein [Acidobacteriota bacterium]